jgi:hypothetical protein
LRGKADEEMKPGDIVKNRAFSSFGNPHAVVLEILGDELAPRIRLRFLREERPCEAIPYAGDFVVVKTAEEVAAERLMK